MGDYRRLSVWKRAHDFTLGVYRSTVSFPDHERYGLTSQLRRAAVSIVSNIAEGASRHGDRELARQELGKMLNGLIRSLRSAPTPNR
jgi:hypothetical protein